jgi:hypothetical protein
LERVPRDRPASKWLVNAGNFFQKGTALGAPVGDLRVESEGKFAF